MSEFKPQLACDANLEKLRFPLMAFPKIDGVRCVHLNNGVTGRSLKQFDNSLIRSRFELPWTKGFDGELVLGKDTDEDICSVTSGYCGKVVEKMVGVDRDAIHYLTWKVFDLIREDTVTLPYIARYEKLECIVSEHSWGTVEVAKFVWVHTLDELLKLESEWLSQGYEGVILRSPTAIHKSGRGTVKENSYLRIKRFVDFEGRLVSVVEAEANNNAPTTNPLGRTERSSAKAGKSKKGEVGSLMIELVNDVVDFQGDVVMTPGSVVKISAGKMTKAERQHVFENQGEYIGKLCKAKMFPKGLKDKPRFPVFLCFRQEEDMS